MRRFLTLGLALALVLGLGSAAMAITLFVPDVGLGARAMGMGGAYVAIADDGTAPYWNPAGITQIKVVGITPALVLEGDFAIPETSIGGEFPPNLGNLDLNLGAMVGVLFKGFGVSVILDADAGTFYNDYGSYQVSGGSTSVVGTGMLTVAHEFGEVIAVGANLKSVYGGRLFFSARNDTYTGTRVESSMQGYALDVGALFKLSDVVRLGAVYENAYSSVETDTDFYNYTGTAWEWTHATHTEEGLGSVIHLGAAFKIPVAGTLIAAQTDIYDDADVTYYRLGVEQSLLVLKLRGGLMLNDGFDIMRYTAGLGFKLGPVVFDVAAVADSDFNLEATVLTAGFKF